MFPDNLDHITGPRYLKLCLSYVAVLILGIATSSAFLRLYPDLFDQKRSTMYLGQIHYNCNVLESSFE